LCFVKLITLAVAVIGLYRSAKGVESCAQVGKYLLRQQLAGPHCCILDMRDLSPERRGVRGLLHTGDGLECSCHFRRSHARSVLSSPSRRAALHRRRLAGATCLTGPTGVPGLAILNT
jgi:hypothetical protein